VTAVSFESVCFARLWFFPAVQTSRLSALKHVTRCPCQPDLARCSRTLFFLRSAAQVLCSAVRGQVEIWGIYMVHAMLYFGEKCTGYVADG
jgi:hypothetical protein